MVSEVLIKGLGRKKKLWKYSLLVLREQNEINLLLEWGKYNNIRNTLQILDLTFILWLLMICAEQNERECYGFVFFKFY